MTTSKQATENCISSFAKYANVLTTLPYFRYRGLLFGFTSIYLFQTVLFPPKFMINAMTDFDIRVVIFPFLDGGVPRRPSYGVYIFQLDRVWSHEDDFHTRKTGLSVS